MGSIARGLVAALLFALAAGPAAAQDFFRGKEIQLLISHPAGGGYDIYARFMARHLPRFLKGQPSIVAQNMPGAAGVVMANSMAVSSKTDGTLIALGPGSLALTDLYGGGGIRYDAGKFSWIGSMNADVGVSVAAATAEVKTAADLMTKELVIGAAGATDQSFIFPTALNRVLGTKFKIVSGYAGTAALTLALERGEIAGIGGMNYSSLLANKPEWLRDRFVTILMQLALDRHPDLRSVPTVLEMARDDRERAVLRMVFSQADMSRLVFGPPGIPAERLAELRAGFGSMIRDEEFLAEARRIKMEINRPMTGEMVADLVGRLRATSPDLIAAAARAVKVGE